jgi:hypothetical protein
MTNEELDEARGNEAYELWCRDQPDGTKGYAPVQVAIRAARLAREGHARHPNRRGTGTRHGIRP